MRVWSRPREVRPWLEILGSIILVLSCFYFFEWSAVGTAIQETPFRAVALSLVLGLVQVLIGFERWRSVLVRSQCPHSFWPTAKVYARSHLLNHCLPGPWAGDALRTIELGKESQYRKVLKTVVVDRLSLPLSIGFLFCLTWTTHFSILVFATISLALSVLLLSFHHHLLGRAVIYSVLLNIMTSIIFILLLGGSMAVTRDFVLVLPIFLFCLAVPISFNGWGIREWAAISLFHGMGFQEEELLAGAVMLGLVSFASAVGFVLLISSMTFIMRSHEES
ncbi:lysylphosphatidylglycerol synthase domain-containing protein [Pseudobacteriovorax antillogorgiicola]|uniref:Lysylphosphatidylglycerol synthase TM region n=1 Tax=Pseudobacteriovorax antillogorgiicola TaxID=1513793 RepID=A0A1Y6C2Z9_9BACT|nr:lysylphosphatidylglycerol synthase domain-containing protein [Pseudobacteriovorax antillogorgiicola]TCS49814.1 lysylphosphatidylglycerol synthase-like protein [Pseudobacteriovorax antillogorgiicola]SMF43194.1 Lysylphosphatidylglycerol synthase TM region [Pseudobacteriovorax antillogorgiicola]